MPNDPLPIYPTTNCEFAYHQYPIRIRHLNCYIPPRGPCLRERKSCNHVDSGEETEAEQTYATLCTRRIPSGRADERYLARDDPARLACRGECAERVDSDLKIADYKTSTDYQIGLGEKPSPFVEWDLKFRLKVYAATHLVERHNRYSSEPQQKQEQSSLGNANNNGIEEEEGEGEESDAFLKKKPKRKLPRYEFDDVFENLELVAGYIVWQDPVPAFKAADGTEKPHENFICFPVNGGHLALMRQRNCGDYIEVLVRTRHKNDGTVRRNTLLRTLKKASKECSVKPRKWDSSTAYLKRWARQGRVMITTRER